MRLKTLGRTDAEIAELLGCDVEMVCECQKHLDSNGNAVACLDHADAKARNKAGDAVRRTKFGRRVTEQESEHPGRATGQPKDTE